MRVQLSATFVEISQPYILQILASFADCNLDKVSIFLQMAAVSSFSSSAIISFLPLLLLLYCIVIYPFSNVSDIGSKWINNADQLSSSSAEICLSSCWQRNQSTRHLEVGPPLKDIYKGLHIRKRFLSRRIYYSSASSASFNPSIIMLMRSGINLVNPGPKQYCQITAGPNAKTSTNNRRLPTDHTKSEPWLAHFNCRSIMAHIDELRLTFQDIRPLFIGITETWLDSSISDSEIDLLGYSVHRLDRRNDRRGGGVALYILDNVKHTVRRDLEDNFEVIWIQMQLKKVNYLIGCVFFYILAEW